ncbi:hypothetical protein S7711_11184, partial [Stachybotrys chartarum IBT 7711]
HGDAEHSVVYASPSLDLADPAGQTDRRLFSHYLWNASPPLAEVAEWDTLGVEAPPGGGGGRGRRLDAPWPPPTCVATDWPSEDIWERDCDGVEREETATHVEEDVTMRKRWLVVAVLTRL